MRAGLKAYRKPVANLHVLFEHPDGRVQVIEGRGGCSYSMHRDELVCIPTDLSSAEEVAYWERRAEAYREMFKEEK